MPTSLSFLSSAINRATRSAAYQNAQSCIDRKRAASYRTRDGDTVAISRKAYTLLSQHEKGLKN